MDGHQSGGTKAILQTPGRASEHPFPAGVALIYFTHDGRRSRQEWVRALSRFFRIYSRVNGDLAAGNICAPHPPPK
jgi:hypothetical protein